MYEVPLEKARNWKPTNTTRGADKAPLQIPQRLDIECPYPACRRSLVGVTLDWKMIPSGDQYVALPCPGCKELIRLLLIHPPTFTEHEAGLSLTALYLYPAPPLETLNNELIASVSPKFGEIYGQTAQAERLGLDQICGMGYRKALEYLIKDYLCYLYPERAKEFRGPDFWLSIAIRELDDPRLQPIAERASWLGNDETHYERRWAEHDVEHLKLAIRLVANLIDAELIRRQLLESMPRES